ncbi:uncharacterized protein LOC135708681 [Ochlerotatus camptorhynchus]|uniref:uncharacterized protein LOC135708681 n=1 Tax=Ochlerotatus camptorhynchus TaxID=644619 RepID=UPI0031DD42AD
MDKLIRERKSLEARLNRASQNVHKLHKNVALQDSQKLYFLKTNLVGEAAALISHLRIEDANYAPALAKLKARYNKPLEITAQHIHRFLNQPSMTSPSAAGLRSLHDLSDEVIRALEAMNQEGRDIWLLYILAEKLDPESKQLWCQKRSELNDDEVTLEKFLKFVDAQSCALKSVQPIRQKKSFITPLPSKPPTRGPTALVTTGYHSPSPMCVFCAKSPHQLYQCGKFLHVSSDDRLRFIRRHELCENCLKQHSGEPCQSGNCRICNHPHHTRLHEALQPPASSTLVSSTATTTNSSGSSSMSQMLISPLSLATDLTDTNVLLLTATINVIDKFGRSHTCRAVLDCASHTSYITADLCKKLGLSTTELDFEYGGIAESHGHANRGALVTFASRCSDYRNVVPCIILERLTSELPLKPINIADWPIPGSIPLADPQFHHPGKISILLGNKLFFQLLEPGNIKLGSDDCLPVLQNTKLGWVVSGGYKNCDNQPRTNAPSCLLTASTDPLSDQLRKFWELEEYTNTSPHFNEEEIRCEEHFTKHTIRDSSGKFIVRLPYLESPTSLGKSREIAEKRLLHLERKLERSPNLKEQYHSFMREYIDLGHMSLATTPASENCVFLPHHCVVKEDSSTTKCRVVFDASAKTSSGKSLNDILPAGPVLQDSLVNILLRFRFPPVVLAGDVKQMYRMVLLYDEDRNYIRILWRWSEDEPILEYCLNTVTYGTKSASYLATKCVQQLLLSHQRQFPDAVKKAIKGIYVDDVLTGADSADEAKHLRQELSIIFSAGGFHLRKWASNSTEALEGVPEADLEMKIPIGLNEPNTIKALGIHWQPCSDEFLFSVQPTKILHPTKRIILSNIASLFDPLGLLAPIIIKAKLLMQHLWELKVDWDAIPPSELTNIWQVFVQGLALLNSFQIPRRVIGTNKTSRIFLHGYSDASERAMGACIYIRAVDDAGNHSSHLLCAKSKVAPIGNKRTTLPRLELCAAVILARLINNVTSAINQPFFEIRAWVDSSVVLAWLNGGASRWKTFVANRVAEITTHVPAINWSHIVSEQNPADLISRGVSPEQIQHNTLWWNGPAWNTIGERGELTDIPVLTNTDQQHIVREQRAVAVSLITVYENDFLDGMMARYYPDLTMLLRVTARILRFRSPDSRLIARLLPRELDRAQTIYIRHVQQQYFREELDRLRQQVEVSSHSSLHQLKPFLDEEGVLRVGGRLQQSSLSYDVRHPILIPRHSILTSFLLNHDHIVHHHCGPQTLLAVSRRRFWIISGSSAARKVYRQCVTCARAKSTPKYQQMGQLPSDRVQPNPPFAVTGVDYAGPVSIVGRRTRGAKQSKGYIALFVCFTTKAVHMEAVSELTTVAFLAAFTRFSSRYGLPAKMFSDNATNFRATAKHFRETYAQINSSAHNNEVTDFLTDKGVEWNFIPARSPHHGGLWESAIKVAKQHLSKITSSYIFTFEELSSLIAQVAATMNSRPLTPISNSPMDDQALTPAHLLIGRALTTVPEVNLLERQISSMSRWQFVQRLSQEFRSRWQTEYVRSLQRMTKWQRSSHNISVGDFVLLVDDNSKPRQWPTGRIVETFPGPDGLTRVVSVRTATGTTRRDVRKVRTIPLDADEYAPRRLQS